MDIAKILKYCHKGTKLYSLVDGTVTLESIDNTKQYPIEVITSTGNTSYFTKDGKIFANRPDGECVLFPSKDQRDWEEFRLPVKKGDIMMSGGRAFIISDEYTDPLVGAYHGYICGIDVSGKFKVSQTNNHWTTSFYIPASEEAKKELFYKMAEAGYRWNADTLKLEKIEPKFKEGDAAIDNLGNLCLLSKVGNNNFVVVSAILYTNGLLVIYDDRGVKRDIMATTLASIEDRNKFFSALVREGYRYDKEQHKIIKQEFKPFDKVLVRNDVDRNWTISQFSYYSENDEKYPFICINNFFYSYCIPYKGNECLLGTANSPT